MSNPLKEKITQYLHDSNHTINSLEKKIGLSKQSVYNLVNGRSPNPTFDTVLKLANAMECSIDELYGRKIENYNHFNQADYELDLLQPACEFIFYYLNNSNTKRIKIGTLVKCLQEICEYSIKNNSGTLDKNFAEWFIKNIKDFRLNN